MATTLGKFLDALKVFPYQDWRDTRNILRAPDTLDGTLEEWQELYREAFGFDKDAPKSTTEIKKTLLAEYNRIMQIIQKKY